MESSSMSTSDKKDKATGKAAAKSTGQEDNDSETQASENKKAVAKRDGTYHRGKWTNEECEYMFGLIEAFKAGHLPLREGTTLRSFLSSMMKCKPKRISKKFEGISYQGRMVYARSKQPISLEQAMLLRARLSELERRYLASAAEQRDGSDSIDALLSQGAMAAAAGVSVAALAAPAADRPLNLQYSSLPEGSDTQTLAGLSQPRLGTDLVLRGDMGIGATEPRKPVDGMGGLSGCPQNLHNMNLAGGLRNLDQTLFGPGTTNTTLISAGLTSGNDAFRNIQALSAQRQAHHAKFPSLASNSVLSDYQAHLRDLNHQQQVAPTLSNAEAGSILAAMQRRLPQNAVNLPLSAHEFNASMLPSVPSAGFGDDQLHTLPNPIAGGGFPTGNVPNDAISVTPSVQHSLELSRLVLQAPHDDTAHFRQRLLPGLSSLTNPLASAYHMGGPPMNQQGLTSQDFANLSQVPLNVGGFSEFLKRKLQETELQDARTFKRQR